MSPEQHGHEVAGVNGWERCTKGLGALRELASGRTSVDAEGWVVVRNSPLAFHDGTVRRMI